MRDFRATLLFTSYCAHVLITIQVPRSWPIFGYVLGSVFVAQPSKVSRNRQKTWQRREKKQATWKDNKYQQTKKEMDRATRSKRKTNVTILWWICWSWSPQKLNSLGSMLVSVVGSTTAPRGHSGLMEESLTRGSIRGDKMWPPAQIQPKNVQMAHFRLYQV